MALLMKVIQVEIDGTCHWNSHVHMLLLLKNDVPEREFVCSFVKS